MMMAQLFGILKEGRKKLNDELRSEVMDFGRKLKQLFQEQLDHDLAARAKAFESMKEQMKKMAEQNASPMDLIDFMEQSYTQLQIPSYDHQVVTINCSSDVPSARDCLVCHRNRRL